MSQCLRDMPSLPASAARLDIPFQERLDALTRQYAEERRARRKSFDDQMRILDRMEAVAKANLRRQFGADRDQ